MLCGYIRWLVYVDRNIPYAVDTRVWGRSYGYVAVKVGVKALVTSWEELSWQPAKLEPTRLYINV